MKILFPLILSVLVINGAVASESHVKDLLDGKTFNCRKFDFEDRKSEENVSGSRVENMKVTLRMEKEMLDVYTEIDYANKAHSEMVFSLNDELKLKEMEARIVFSARAEIQTPIDTEINGHQKMTIRLNDKGEVKSLRAIKTTFGGLYAVKILSCDI